MSDPMTEFEPEQFYVSQADWNAKRSRIDALDKDNQRLTELCSLYYKDIGRQQDCISTLRERIATLKKVSVRLYNQGYHAGHNDTVESCYTDILPVDMDTYHADVVAEILKEKGNE